jgi:T5SS/PEP-CTERM-associated repeat protein
MKHPRLHFLPGAVFVLIFACLGAARGTDTWWTGGDGNLTNAAKWTAGVPGASDSAFFTNGAGNFNLTNSADLAVANVSMNMTGNPQAIYRGGATTLFVTNRFAVGEAPGSTGSFYFLSGNLVVTNADRTAVFYGGTYPGGGSSSLIHLGGNLVADRFYLTNQTSHLSFGMGSLTAYAGVSLVITGSSGNITFGSSALGPMQVNLLGGSNQVISADPGAAFALGDNAGRSGRLVVSGQGTYLTNKTASFSVGQFGYGEFIVSNGAKVVTVANTTIGNSASSSSNSSALVTGSGTYWTNTGSLTIGAATNASLTISDGATLALGANSTISASGGSRSPLLVTTNGTLSSNVRFTITGTGNSAPLVAVVGSNATVSSAEVRLSGMMAGGAPSILVTNGGRWTSSSSFGVGYAAGSVASVLISGTNSMISVQNFNVGSNTTYNVAGAGYALINDGATLEVANQLATGRIGSPAGSGIISNIGGVFQFRANATPTLFTNLPNAIVLKDGVLSMRDVAAANPNAAWVGQITMVGDNTYRLLNATNVTGMASYTFKTNNGSSFAALDLQSNSYWRSTSLVVGDGGRLSGNGTLAVGTVTNQGTIAPGNSPGLLSFSNNLTLTASSVLSLEIGGTNLGAFDRILVGGVLSKTGAVNVSLLDYNPSVGDSFDLLDWGSVLGSFATLNLPSLSGGLQWDSTSFESQGILLVTSAIPEPSTLALALLAASALLWRRHPRA